MDYGAFFQAVTRDERYQRNIEWGEPRSGHPEGKVSAHIAELERNAASFRDRLSESEFWKLRVLIHVHDTFKCEAREGARIMDPQSHASLARQFLAGFTSEPGLLAIVQFHDEPYALWRQVQHRSQYDHARFDALLATIHDWDLFLAFLIVDGCTGGKKREPLHWFFAEVAGRVESQFSAADILEG